MTQSIDPIRLKAAAEHLEWVLRQYPDSKDVQSLLHALTPLIEAAKEGAIEQPIDSEDIPGAYSFSAGLYMPYESPNVDEGYARFSIELRGGLSEQAKRQIAKMDEFRRSLVESDGRE